MKRKLVLLIVVWLCLGIAIGIEAQQSKKSTSDPPAIQGQDVKRSSTPDIATLSPPLRSLVEKLRGNELSAQLEGASGLGQMGERAAPAIPFLLEVLQRSDGMVEVDAALMKYFDHGTVYLASREKIYMIDPAQIVTSASLAKIGKPAIHPLTVALEGADPAELYFAHVADALARIPDPAATAVLLNLLKSENRHARSRAAASLRSNSDPVALDALIAAVEDSDEFVRKEAVRALEKRTGQSLGQDAAQWRAWREKNR